MHKLYAFARQSDFVRNITNQVYQIDNVYNNYKLKILKLIENHDITNLTKQLFWKPNAIASFLLETGDDDDADDTDDNEDIVEPKEYIPFLFSIASQFHSKQSKFVLFFLNCLFHLSYILLDEPHSKDNEFLAKYFNWNQCNQIVTSSHFFGIPIEAIKSTGLLYSIIDLIMKQPYFNGLSQIRDVTYLWLHFYVLFVCFCF